MRKSDSRVCGRSEDKSKRDPALLQCLGKTHIAAHATRNDQNPVRPVRDSPERLQHSGHIEPCYEVAISESDSGIVAVGGYVRYVEVVVPCVTYSAGENGTTVLALRGSFTFNRGSSRQHSIRAVSRPEA